MDRRQFLLAGSSLAATASFTGAARAQSVAARVGYIPIVGTAPFFVANGEGWLKQGGLDVAVTVFVQIETADHSGPWLEKFAQMVAAMPEVMEFYRMAGDVDYMLRVVVADMVAYDGFYKKLIETIPLKNVTSRFAMERIKATTAYKVPDLPRN